VPFDPSISCFRRANDPTHPVDTPLSEVVARIRSDELAERCTEIRCVFAKAGGGEAGKRAICEMKKPLPGVTLAGTFERRSNTAWRQPSALVGIDIDGLDGETMATTWATLTAAPWVALLFRSPSGSGLKGAVRVPDFTGPDRNAYSVAWEAVTLWLTSLGMVNDPAVKDVARLAFLAHDPNAYLNPDPAIFDVPRWDVGAPAEPPPKAVRRGLRPGDDYNQNADIRPLLEQHGWTYLHTANDGNEHWCRPGKDEGTSATLKERVFWVFSSNAPPFQADTGYGPFAVLGLLEFGGDFAAAARALRQHGFGGHAPNTTGSIIEDPAEPEPSDPGPVPVELLQVPGFVGRVMDFCLATAPYPNPVLAFCGAMSLQATLAGRRVRDEGDNRSNLYLLGLANSGAGKDHPRKINQRILLETGLANQVGDAFASAEGVEDRMLLTPCMLFQTDEMDALLLSIREGQDGRSERIMQALLKFYTSANAIYPMRVKAGKEPEFINQPCLSIFGTAIPQHFYESLSAKMLSNGFFARMLVLEAGKRGTGQRATTPPIPVAILDTANWWRDFQPGKAGNLGVINPTPVVVPTTADAQALLDDIRHQAERDYTAHEAKGDQMGMAIWARAAEKVHRLALCYACSENHQDPMITAKAVEWAWKLTEHQTRRMIAMATIHVYESDFDQKQKRAIQAIRAKGGALSLEQMTRALRTLSVRDRDEVLGNLLATGQIVLVSEQTGGRPRTLYRIPTLYGKSPVDGKSDA
jgi:hypothetical protein